MAPQAVLTFTPSSPVPAPVDAFDLSALGSFALRPSSPSQTPRLECHGDSYPEAPHKPTAVAPTVSVTGPFSLLKGGAIQVGDLRVVIERGTFVGRCSGLGETGGDSRGLWWQGFGTRAERGVWELQLVNATEADVVAVHRLLLYLPPSSTPSRPRLVHPVPAPRRDYRNSLVLYDNATHRVVSVMPLEHPAHPRRGPLPALPTSKPLPARPPHPPPTPPRPPLSPGARLAEYVDGVVKGIHPDPTPDSLSAAERLEQARIARQASREEKQWDPFMLGNTFLVTPSVDASSVKVAMDEGISRAPDQPREARSDDADSDAPSPAHTLTDPTLRSRQGPSERSVSSFATFGTERFVTADEFDDEVETSKSSMFAELADEGAWVDFVSQSDEPARKAEEADEDPTPTPTKLVDSPRPDSVDDSPGLPTLDPAHSLTNGNAVLLSFLGAPSSILASSLSTPTRVRVSAHPLSNDQVSAQIDAGAIRPAEVVVKESEARRQGWFDWWSSLFGSASEPSSFAASPRDWLAWLPWPWSTESAEVPRARVAVSTTAESDALSTSGSPGSNPSSSPMSDPVASSSRSTPSGLDHRHGEGSGGASSRLSIIYVDSEGHSSRAFVPSGASHRST
ncbi:hypothetical protein JCM11491_007237 [Sporobolomyces phaffii]